MRKAVFSKDRPSVVFQGKFLKLIRHGGWEFSQRTNCTGIVVIVAMTQDNRIILVKQFRPPVGRYCIELPAGLVNDQGKIRKESLAAAAKRELLEETGYEAKTLRKIMDGPGSPGSSCDIMSLFKAEGLKKVHEGGGDHTEDIEVCEIPLAQIDAWLKKKEKEGCFIDPKVFAGLYFLGK